MPFFAVLFFSLFLGQSNDLTLSVNVVDQANKPLPQAAVLLENTAEQKRFEGTSAENGSFRFDRLPIGSYVLRVVKEGYYPNSVELRLEASKVADVTLVAVEGRHDEV